MTVVNLWPVSFLIQKLSAGSVLFTLLLISWICLEDDSRPWRVKLRLDMEFAKTR